VLAGGRSVWLHLIRLVERRIAVEVEAVFVGKLLDEFGELSGAADVVAEVVDVRRKRRAGKVDIEKGKDEEVEETGADRIGDWREDGEELRCPAEERIVGIWCYRWEG
jgi:hypothetical protein